MRDRKFILAIILLSVLFVAMAVFLPFPSFELSFLWVFAFVIVGMVIFWWVLNLFGQKIGPMYSWYGGRTAVKKLDPLDSCTMKDVKNSKEYPIALVPKNGCELAVQTGGGKAGALVYRADLAELRIGNPAQVHVYGVPYDYKLNAEPGGPYRDLAGLPPEIKRMIMKPSNKFHPDAIYTVIVDPFPEPVLKELNKAKRDAETEVIDYKSISETLNAIIEKKDAIISGLGDGSAAVARAHDSIVSGFTRKKFLGGGGQDPGSGGDQ